MLLFFWLHFGVVFFGSVFAFVIAFVFLVAFCDCFFASCFGFFQDEKLPEQRGLADTMLALSQMIKHPGFITDSISMHDSPDFRPATPNA